MPTNTYLVGRLNREFHCDIALPANERSVSRKHLELTVVEDGRFYLVHLHPRNTTHAFLNGAWRQITQDYVNADTLLLVGNYETTAGRLFAMRNPFQPNVS